MVFLALRNLIRHAAHSILLIALFALASFLFISGNSFLSHSNQMLQKLFTGNITGDAVIAAKTDTSLSIFGSNTPAIGEFIPIPILEKSEELMQAIEAQPDVKAVAPILSGAAVMEVSGFSMRRRMIPLFGIEPDEYFSVLKNLECVDGRLLKKEEKGAMLTENLVNRIEKETGKQLGLGSEIIFTTGKNHRFRIRAVPLVGTFRYPVSMEYVNNIALVDSATVRELNDIQRNIIKVRTKNEGPRNVSEVDSLFSNQNKSNENAGNVQESASEISEGGITAEKVLERVKKKENRQDTAGKKKLLNEVHFLLIRWANDGHLNMSNIENIAQKYGADLLSWRKAAGQSALLALLLQLVFNGGFGLFVLAVILGATNIVLISTYQRTREIGTLRAIGAEDNTVRRIFLVEHIVMGVLGWLLGLVGSVVLSIYIALQEIIISNQLLAILLGGRQLFIPVDIPTVFISLIVVIGIVGLSVLFPLSQVMRKPIVEAIRNL